MNMIERSFCPALLSCMLSCSFLSAQSQQQPEPASAADGAKVVGQPETPQARLARAWELLSMSVADPRHTDTRIQSLAALSGIPNNTHAAALVRGAMKDTEVDVRTAAVLAAGKMRTPSLASDVRGLLNDPEPQAAFTAATTLWSDFKDRSGEDILVAVADGDRKATAGLMHGAQHSMSKTLHSPAALAKLGAQTGAGLLLGPFGFSVAAIEYMRKNGSDSARVQAIELISQQKTPALREEMMDALSDKDPGVRAAAVKALGDLHSKSYATAVGPLMDDAKLPVRLTAAAAYINSMGGAASPGTAKPASPVTTRSVTPGKP